MTLVAFTGSQRRHCHVWQPDGFAPCGRYLRPTRIRDVTGRAHRLCRYCERNAK